MSDENIIKINKNDSQSTILTTINHNFRVLTSRMKELNFSLSYLDVLRISKVHPVTEQPGSDAAAREFVSSTWNLLGNYEGAYITGSGDNLFTWQGEQINTGDFIIKLPGNNSIHIAGEDARYYYPTEYDSATGTIAYTYNTTASTVNGVVVPTIAAAPAYITTGIIGKNETTTITAATYINHVECYTVDTSIEPVYNAVTVSGTSIHNETNFSLTIVASYK